MLWHQNNKVLLILFIIKSIQPYSIYNNALF